MDYNLQEIFKAEKRARQAWEESLIEIERMKRRCGKKPVWKEGFLSEIVVLLDEEDYKSFEDTFTGSKPCGMDYEEQHEVIHKNPISLPGVYLWETKTCSADSVRLDYVEHFLRPLGNLERVERREDRLPNRSAEDEINELLDGLS